MQPTTADTGLFTRARRVLERIDEKAADLNELRWTAAYELWRLSERVTGLDTIAEQLGRKRVDVVSYITTWVAYGDDAQVRREQTYSGLQRLVRRYPDDPAARQAIIDQARRECISVATVMDHAGYRGQSRGKGGSSHDPEDSLTKQLLALGAPSHVVEAWHGLDTALHHFGQVGDAAVPAEVVGMVRDRMRAVKRAWERIEDMARLTAMANGEAF